MLFNVMSESAVELVAQVLRSLPCGFLASRRTASITAWQRLQRWQRWGGGESWSRRRADKISIGLVALTVIAPRMVWNVYSC